VRQGLALLKSLLSNRVQARRQHHRERLAAVEAIRGQRPNLRLSEVDPREPPARRERAILHRLQARRKRDRLKREATVKAIGR
jgi:hypothetical protein